MIVIAVVAVLAAVLIPTFSNIIAAAKLSNDRTFVAQANKALLYDSLASRDAVTYEEAKAMLKNAGYTVPCKPETKDLKFYLASSENRVVLVFEADKTALYPDDFTNTKVDSDWVDLSEEKPQKPVEEPETQTDGPEQQEQQDTHEEEQQQPQKHNTIEEFINDLFDFFKHLFG